ncbi:uncharacterized protein M421DRAFT_104907 [Didymella exigua CBS 183.55]|uniref:F-box domain-containing protein n=1 Tax=Didymella exigua CBS 183.55 TaxID=1150837 RepID=A0A6A5R502_9PLEO|nr:uncharacterized protein M421DRAFT_104907 [Didymella exigua CBS 183.55]KAF1922713.1 hypothetical protein M421DRAFT_104907 [Didymella exigua CBS 183.55]
MASRTWTRTRSPSTSSDSSDTTMLDAPTHVPLTPTRPRQPSVTQRAPPAQTPAPDPSFSLLLSLPRELRDRVYGLALASPHPFWWPGQAPARHGVGVALLQTSRQVHDEAAPLLYTANKFLFTHPSDCTVFRVVASRHAARIASVYFRIRERDLPLWTKYLGSRKDERCLKHDLPRLKTLSIFLRCGTAVTPRLVAHLAGPAFNAPHALAALPPAMAVHPPPHGTHNLLATFLRHERELGIESLCLSLRDTLHEPDTRAGDTTHYAPPAPAAVGGHRERRAQDRERRVDRSTDTATTSKASDAPQVKIVCIMRVPTAEVARLVRLYPAELSVDRGGDARTRSRRLHGVDVCVEISGVPGP